MTDLYDETNPEHVQSKKDIEEGNALPDIFTTAAIVEAMEEVGFEIIEEDDLAASYDPEVQYSWYRDLEPSYFSPYHLQFTGAGRFIAEKGLNTLEFLKIMPKGSAGVSLVY